MKSIVKMSMVITSTQTDIFFIIIMRIFIKYNVHILASNTEMFRYSFNLKVLKVITPLETCWLKTFETNDLLQRWFSERGSNVDYK